MRTYKFRIYPNKEQEEKFIFTLDSCRELYNVALQQRRDVYLSTKKTISCYFQQKELPLLREQFPEYKSIHSHVLRNVLKRVDSAFMGFFRRVKIKGEKAGYPRFKSKNGYDSFCYPQGGFKLSGIKIKLFKIGYIKINLHRDIPENSQIKMCTIKREGAHWYCIFVIDVQISNPEKKQINKSTGIDLGLTDFMVLSNGTKIKNPKYFRQSEEKLKAIQSKYSKGKSKKIRKQLTGLHRKIVNQRKDFQHKLSRQLVNDYDLISYEDLKIKHMIEDNKYHLQKHITDASWGRFIHMLKYKAEEAGVWCVGVDPRGTTQKCSHCGSDVPKKLHVRSHKCACGFEATRDHNAALNIHKLGTNLVNQAMSEISEATL